MTSEPHALRSNVVSLIVATALANAVRFLTNWLIAWIYGPDDHGRFALVFGLISLLVVVGELGIVTSFGVRQIALATQGDRSTLNTLINRLSGVLLLINFGLAVALLVLAGPIGAWLKVDPVLLRIVSIWPIGFCFYRLTMMIGNGLEAMTYSTRTTTIFHGLWLIWLGIGLATDRSLQHLLVGFSITFALAGPASWLVMPPLLSRQALRWRPQLASLGLTFRTIMTALPYSLPQMGVLILPSVMCLLIITWHGQDQVSFFQIAYSLAILTHLIALPMGFAMLPRLTRLISADEASQQTARQLVRNAGTLLIGLGSLTFALYWAAGDIILNLLGPDYGSQWNVLMIIAAGVIFDVHRTLIDQLFMASRHVAYVAWSEIARYVVLITVACWSIPNWGVVGAAVAVSASMLVNFLAKLIGAYRLMKLNLWNHCLTLVIVLALMFVAGWLTDRGAVVLFVWLVAGIAFRIVRPIEWFHQLCARV